MQKTQLPQCVIEVTITFIKIHKYCQSYYSKESNLINNNNTKCFKNLYLKKGENPNSTAKKSLG